MAFLRRFYFYESLRSSIQSIIGRSLILNLRIFRAHVISPYTGHPFHGKPLDKHLDKIFNYKLLSKGFAPFYVEAGAHDGLTSSNTFFLEKKYNFLGLLIEPSLKLFLECVDTRNRNNLFELTALGSTDDKTLSLVYSDSMTVSLDSDCELDESHAIKGSNLMSGNRDAKMVTFISPSTRLTSLLIKNHCPHSIFFLSLDTEGMELPILQGIDFNIYRFAYILLETRKLQDITNYLEPHGYSHIATFGSHDHLFGFSL